jgi:hypothetical protein
MVSVAGLGGNNFGRRLDRSGTRAVVDAAIDAADDLADLDRIVPPPDRPR